MGVDVFEPAIPMAKMYAATIGILMDLEQAVSRCTPSTTSTATTVQASSVMANVFETAIPMAKVYADLDEAQLLSEINEHMNLIDTYGRTTGMRTSPIEALVLRMVMIVDETDVPVDGIVKGNAPTIRSEMGILMDLEQVVSRCTTSAASTVEASSVKANMVEPNVPMPADFPTTEVDADAISLPTTPESGRTTKRIAGLKGHRVHLPKSET